MKILIHACPQRMWYVNEQLAPSLIAQGADVEIWNDKEGKGNLKACMESFAARKGDGATWHIQDDVLVCRDFVKRCEQYDGIVYGFCNERFTDDASKVGAVSVHDSWHSFQCVRIPDAYARECADWVRSGAWKESTNRELPILHERGIGDDTFFREFLLARHGTDTVTNAKPNLAEHVDFLIGGSVLSWYRDFRPRAHYWEDEELVTELRVKLNR